MNKINPLIIDLLHKRGIDTEEDIQEFLSDKPQKTYDPFLLMNMKAGVDLILSTIREGKSICIYGDYDADGITSVTLMLQVLGELTDKLSYYIPSRFEEGYGLNNSAIDIIKERGADLIITVDCGSVSFEEVEYAKRIGLGIIVTDHHSITDKKADCILINPKQPGCQYPFKYLAGVGVAFKLAQALSKQGKITKSTLNKVLDVVAIGTIGDIVPLVDENRTIAKYGMRALNNTSRKGLTSLINAISLKKGKISSDNVAFGIVPHLNAAGRMLDAKIAVELLVCQDERKVQELVCRLVENNKERKKVQEQTYKICLEIIENTCIDDNFIVMTCEDAHEGIAGIVAGKLKEKFNKPVIITTPSGEYLKGTGRSIEGINLYETLRCCEELFFRFGGHAGACGFLMEKDNFKLLKESLNKILDKKLEEEPTLLEKKIFADIDLDIGNIDLELILDMEKLSPFGNQNEKPIFLLKNVIAEDLQLMGEEETHGRFVAMCNTGEKIKCILFSRIKEYIGLLGRQEPVDIYGALECQEWNGNKKIQFMVSEIKSRN